MTVAGLSADSVAALLQQELVARHREQAIRDLDKLAADVEGQELHGDYIKQCGEKWCVYSETNELLGEHETQAEAQAQLSAIKARQDPFANEHAARQEDPGKYSEFRRAKWPGASDGVFVIYGIRTVEGQRKTEIQSVRFLASKWTPSEAKAWLESHDLKFGDFEVATGDRGDGAVWRMSRLALMLDDAQKSVLDRAIAVADRLAQKTDALELKTIADELRADGLDDYIQDGFLMLPVLAARTGTQPYSDGRTTWGEFRSDEEVEASLSSYGLKPFTDDHPPGMVTSNDYGSLVKGACGQDAILLEKPAADGNRYVKLTLLVGDAATIRKIRDGKVELSAGYTTVPVYKPGTDSTGKTYDYLQTKIRINHLALVDRGRAGPLARISVDGAAWEIPAPTTDAQERDDVKTNNDQLDPEMARMILMAAMAYMMPESPEAAAGALEKLVAMTGLEAEELMGMLKHEMPKMETPPDMEMVEMDGGITSMMTVDNAAAYRDRLKANHDGEATLKKDLAETTAALRATQRQVDKLQAAQDRAEFEALYEEIRGVCPQMVKAWDEQRKAKTFSLDAAQMREKATLDLDPGAAIDIDDARGTDTFDATLKGAYRAALGGARRRKANADGSGTKGSDADNASAGNLISVLDRLNANHKQFVGK